MIQRNRELKIQTVMNHIEEQVPGIKFLQVLKDSEAVIRIAFNHEHPYGKTWSRVGIEAADVSSNEPTLNLSDVSGHESGGIQEGSKEYGGIMHEFLHTLGMHHEHQHPDRPFDICAIGTLPLILYYNKLMELPAVRKDMEDEGWSEEDVDNNIVKRLNHNMVGACSQPDMCSCMK